MELRTQAALLGAVLGLAFAAAVLLRPRRGPAHWRFAAFASNVSLWYLSAFMGALFGGPIWLRVNLALAAALPATAIRVLAALPGGADPRLERLSRLGLGAAVGLVPLVVTPLGTHRATRIGLFAFVLLLLGAALGVLGARARSARNRYEATRLWWLVGMGAAAALFTWLDYLPYVGLEIPPVGTLLVLAFLSLLAQSVVRERLLDMVEAGARLAVLVVLAFALGGIAWGLWALTGGRFFLHTVVAAFVLLLLFEPLRQWAERRATALLLRERIRLERAVEQTRKRLARILELDELAPTLLDGLCRVGRLPASALYLANERSGSEMRLAGRCGSSEAPERLERAAMRPLLELLEARGEVDRRELRRALRDLDARADPSEETERLQAALAVLETLEADLVLPLRGERPEPYGLLVLRDDRRPDGFSPEERAALRSLAAQAAIAIDNSRLHRRLQERDRLAALGEMSAGLAHEIRNPLGAIAAAAELLGEELGPCEQASADDGEAPQDFVRIIVEEARRLDQVVGSFLAFARPTPGRPEPVDLRAAVEATARLLRPQAAEADIDVELELPPNGPHVRIDAGQLRQVLLNLARNAFEAMDGGGRLTLSVRELREQQGARWRRVAVVAVTDSGPGIPRDLRDRLFVPFVTTKPRGTGLGLAISQRLVAEAGGRIEVRDAPGGGAQFEVRLPVAADGSSPPPSASSGSGPDSASGTTTNR